MAAVAFGVQGLPGVGVWAWGHVTHTYCIFCGSVPRHKALGKQKGCLQREGGGEATLAFQFPGKDPARDWRPSSLPGPFSLLPHHLPATLVVALLGLTGQDPLRAGSHTGQRQPALLPTLT